MRAKQEQLLEFGGPCSTGLNGEWFEALDRPNLSRSRFKRSRDGVGSTSRAMRRLPKRHGDVLYRRRHRHLQGVKLDIQYISIFGASRCASLRSRASIKSTTYILQLAEAKPEVMEQIQLR